jgi:Tfp pilus assembly protein PilX
MKAANHGIILISALLFLSTLTLLTLNILQTNLLESKMSNNYKDSLFALYQAENILIAKEKLLIQSPDINTLPPDIALISTDICGISFYRIQVNITENGINKKLQSTYAIRGDVSQCNPQPTIKTGRQSWLEIM